MLKQTHTTLSFAFPAKGSEDKNTQPVVGKRKCLLPAQPFSGLSQCIASSLEGPSSLLLSVLLRKIDFAHQGKGNISMTPACLYSVFTIFWVQPFKCFSTLNTYTKHTTHKSMYFFFLLPGSFSCKLQAADSSALNNSPCTCLLESKTCYHVTWYNYHQIWRVTKVLTRS